MGGRGGWKFGEIVCPLIDEVIFLRFSLCGCRASGSYNTRVSGEGGRSAPLCGWYGGHRLRGVCLCVCVCVWVFGEV